MTYSLTVHAKRLTLSNGSRKLEIPIADRRDPDVAAKLKIFVALCRRHGFEIETRY